MIEKTPESRTGVYTRPSEISEHNRVRSRADRSQFEGRDVWAEYWGEGGPSSKRQTHAERHWNSVMADRGVHHALAEPEDAAAFAAYLLKEQEYAPTTVKSYWGAVHRLYEWLKSRTDFPHLYNSTLVAAASDETAREAFDHYVTYYSDL